MYPFSVQYVRKLDSWAHILMSIQFGLKLDVTIIGIRTLSTSDVAYFWERLALLYLVYPDHLKSHHMLVMTYQFIGCYGWAILTLVGLPY
jgi:hypothetical protein